MEKTKQQISIELREIQKEKKKKRKLIQEENQTDN